MEFKTAAPWGRTASASPAGPAGSSLSAPIGCRFWFGWSWTTWEKRTGLREKRRPAGWVRFEATQVLVSHWSSESQVAGWPGTDVRSDVKPYRAESSAAEPGSDGRRQTWALTRTATPWAARRLTTSRSTAAAGHTATWGWKCQLLLLRAEPDGGRQGGGKHDNCSMCLSGQTVANARKAKVQTEFGMRIAVWTASDENIWLVNKCAANWEAMTNTPDANKKQTICS